MKKFNDAPSYLMHIDLNSCFATIEQQANPLLRGRPIAVAAYNSPNGCILAPSIEAKKFGIKTGFRVKEGKALCPGLIILSPDPDKYRYIHLKLRQLLLSYTTDLTPKSIDEFVLNFQNFPSFNTGLLAAGRQIKTRIKQEIGDWLTVSIGIGPNRFLAKLASNLKKPDGLEEINYQNYFEIYSKLKLPDLNGINTRLTARLNSGGIYTVLQFYESNIYDLRSVFHSISGYYWYLRLRGYEIDDIDFGRKSFGNMYSLPKHFSDSQDLSPVLHKLIEKMSFRLRSGGYKAKGIHLGILYTDHTFWHQGKIFHNHLFDSGDIFRASFRLLLLSGCKKPVANISVSCFDLTQNPTVQLDLFSSVLKKINLSKAVDSINQKYGHFVVSPSAMLGTSSLVPDRIGFGSIGDLTEFITS